MATEVAALCSLEPGSKKCPRSIQKALLAAPAKENTAYEMEILRPFTESHE